ncbi:hypothetical protein K9N68_21570 [Kovacikia minuta CCNUW1]|uniref:hypothetical protein n=1 Tax=Kovacikia minuta TaxID=2931930 RepID=UPI001CCDBE92|nr:hypothetical protein [Kovacikia minuta]UBF24283.1 hypothetical protein K9N68_21570 [Kovacikia minuta CCNUW1]
MTLDWFYKLGDWNPQFFREFKGRLKLRNVVVFSLTSLLIQMLVMAYFWMALPASFPLSPSRYCTGAIDYADYHKCLTDAFGNVVINWQVWWFDLFQTLSWGMPFIVLIAGVYMLISDLGKEERRGTLNFIRLTPQSSQSILLGKILGVPAIPYLMVALAIPLHLIAAAHAGVPFAEVLSIYILTGAAASCYFVGALLFAFLGGVQGWLGAIAVWLTFSISFQIWRNNRYSEYPYFGPSQYYGIPVANHLSLAVGFALLTFGLATYWLWRTVNRRFRNPNTTLLSKQQSYWVTACFEVWLLGFVIREVQYPSQPIDDFAVVAFVNLLWFVLLIAALMPQRQMLLDWTRYRRERVSSGKKFWSRSILKELTWGAEKPRSAGDRPQPADSRSSLLSLDSHLGNSEKSVPGICCPPFGHPVCVDLCSDRPNHYVFQIAQTRPLGFWHGQCPPFCAPHCPQYVVLNSHPATCCVAILRLCLRSPQTHLCGNGIHQFPGSPGYFKPVDHPSHPSIA